MDFKISPLKLSLPDVLFAVWTSFKSESWWLWLHSHQMRHPRSILWRTMTIRLDCANGDEA
ncbi:MAG: hypothetical protein NZ781_03065 [Armatimonadetes bacterium]|nr:hypothetical protein [Armatimonadota bacterium]